MTAYAAICDEGNLHKIAYRLNYADCKISAFLPLLSPQLLTYLVFVELPVEVQQSTLFSPVQPDFLHQHRLIALLVEVVILPKNN